MLSNTVVKQLMVYWRGAGCKPTIHICWNFSITWWRGEIFDSHIPIIRHEWLYIGIKNVNSISPWWGRRCIHRNEPGLWNTTPLVLIRVIWWEQGQEGRGIGAKFKWTVSDFFKIEIGPECMEFYLNQLLLVKGKQIDLTGMQTDLIFTYISGPVTASLYEGGASERMVSVLPPAASLSAWMFAGPPSTKDDLLDEVDEVMLNGRRGCSSGE